MGVFTRLFRKPADEPVELSRYVVSGAVYGGGFSRNSFHTSFTLHASSHDDAIARVERDGFRAYGWTVEAR